LRHLPLVFHAAKPKLKSASASGCLFQKTLYNMTIHYAEEQSQVMTETEKTTFLANIAEIERTATDERKNTILGMIKPQVVECDPEQQRITVAYPAMDWERNPHGVIHGGIVSTMFDTAMGIATYAVAGGMTPTISISVSFLRPVPGKGTVLVKAAITKAGRSVLYASAEMYEEGAENTPLATAQGVFHR